MDRAELTRWLLGLPGEGGELPPLRWPTLAETAERFGLTAGRVAAASELVDQLLVSRGCVREEIPERRRAYGYAVLRAAIEADSNAEAPRFATRRHAGRILVAFQAGDDEPIDTPSDAALLDMAVALGDEAVKLAARDPLPTPVTVVRTLAWVAERFELVPAEQRLVRLAAAASGSVLANARLELYPRDLDPVRALRLSQAGAGVPREGLRPDTLTARVAGLTGVEPVDASAAFVTALRQFAVDRCIADFGIVLRADAPDADPRSQRNLQRVVDETWQRLERQWSAHQVLVLDGLTALGRYGGGTALLDRMLAAARGAGRDGGPRTVVWAMAGSDAA